MRGKIALAVVLAAGAASALTPASYEVREPDEFSWKPSNGLPPGAEYHLIREDPETSGVQAIVRFPKGYSVPAHQHAYDETLVILKGKLELAASGQPARTIGPGGYAFIPKGVPHEMKVAGWGEVRMVATIAGPYSVKPAE